MTAFTPQAPPRPCPPMPPEPIPGPPPPNFLRLGYPDPGQPVPNPPPSPGGPRHGFLLTWAALTSACLLLTVGLALLVMAMLRTAPIDFNEWLVAFVAVAALASRLVVRGPKRPARPARAGNGKRVNHSGVCIAGGFSAIPRG